jgi:hypothetical protein
MCFTEDMKNTIQDYMSTIGKKGGKATRKKYGKKHYSEIAKKRWAKVMHSKPLASSGE